MTIFTNCPHYIGTVSEKSSTNCFVCFEISIFAIFPGLLPSSRGP